MDKMLYIAMNGGKQALKSQSVVSNNLANVSTTGFRSEFDVFRSLRVEGEGFDSRVYNYNQKEGINFEAGPLMTTGRELDIAVRGEGFIAVQGKDGTEAYTRAGDLLLDANGFLTTGTGRPVLGNGGPIAIPPASKVDIGVDGTISIIPLGQNTDTVAVVDRIRLVNPDQEQLIKGADGLLRQQNGEAALADAGVTLVSGAIEGSNVNAMSELLSMISTSRQFETQIKLMSTAEDIDSASATLLRQR